MVHVHHPKNRFEPDYQTFFGSLREIILVQNSLKERLQNDEAVPMETPAPFRLHKVDKKVVDASNFLGRKDNYSIYNAINKDMSLLIFKALNNLAPNYICSKINMARNSHSHNTRGAAKNHLQLSSANNKFGLNDLPSQLLEIESLLKFKTSVNDFFQKMYCSNVKL